MYNVVLHVNRGQDTTADADVGVDVVRVQVLAYSLLANLIT